MSTPLLIIIAVFLVGTGLYFYKHSHHRNLAANEEQLKATIVQIFKEANKSPISQNRLIKGLKQHFHINEKVALILIGKARAAGLIKIDGENVTLPD